MHVTKKHNGRKRITAETTLFLTLPVSEPNSPSLETPSLPASATNGSENAHQLRQPTSRSLSRSRPYLRISPSSSRTHLSADRSASPAIHSPAQPSPLNQSFTSKPATPSSESDSSRMEVDDDDALLLSRISFKLITLSVLNVFPCPELLACTQCLCGIPPASVLKHADSHGIEITRAEKRTLTEWMSSRKLAKRSEDLTTPPPNSSPISGLKIFTGHACTLCRFCACEPLTIQKHLSQEHHNRAGTWQENCKAVSLQAFFRTRPCYFAVKPALAGLMLTDLYRLYLEQIAPPIDESQRVNPPQDPHEVPPLVRMMGWHEHLAPYLTDRSKIRSIRGLMQLPTASQGVRWLGAPLRATITRYMKDIRTKANNSPLAVRCLLMECPRYVVRLVFSFRFALSNLSKITRTTQYGIPWQPLLNDNSLQQYGRLLHHWTHAILVSLDGHELQYIFPLTDSHKELAEALLAVLKGGSETEAVMAFHSFIYPVLCVHSLGRIEAGDYTK